MLPRWLPAAQSLEPLQQGDLSNLCGLYSIINGIERAAFPHHKLRRKHRAHLYAHGIEALSRTRRLSTILQHGMSEKLWHLLRDTLIDETLLVAGFRIRWMPVFRGKRKFAEWEALKPIRRCLWHHGPVLVNLRGVLSHYTIIVGWIDNRLILFDSAGLKWILASNTGIDHRRSIKRHRIRTESAFCLRLEDVVGSKIAKEDSS